MKESDCILSFWEYFVERWAQINNLTAKSTISLYGYNNYTSITGKGGGISNLFQYKLYKWLHYI